MADDKALKSTNTSGLDRRLILYLLALEKRINRDLDKLSADLIRELKAASKGDKVVSLKAFNSKADKIVDKYFRDYQVQVVRYGGTVAAYKAKAAFDEVEPVLIRLGYDNTVLRMRRKQKGYSVRYQAVINARKVEALGGYTFTKKMKTAHVGTTKVIRAIVENNVAKGKGAKDIAKIIDVFVKPTGKSTRVKPFDEIRRRLGRPKNYVPKDVPSGSVQYNALRIARTETAYTYRQATVDFYKDEDFVKGYKWVLSNRHPEGDICDTWAAEELYPKDGSGLPSGHPNCLCDTKVVRYTDKELEKLGLD